MHYYDSLGNERNCLISLANRRVLRHGIRIKMSVGRTFFGSNQLLVDFHKNSISYLLQCHIEATLPRNPTDQGGIVALFRSGDQAHPRCLKFKPHIEFDRSHQLLHLLHIYPGNVQLLQTRRLYI